MRDEMVCRNEGIIEFIHTNPEGKLIQIENFLRRRRRRRGLCLQERRMKFAMTYAGTKCRGPHCLKAQNIFLRHLTQTPKAARTVSQKIYSSAYPLSSINVWTLFSIRAMTSSRVFWPEKYAGISSLTMTMIAGSREATWEQVAIISSFS